LQIGLAQCARNLRGGRARIEDDRFTVPNQPNRSLGNSFLLPIVRQQRRRSKSCGDAGATCGWYDPMRLLILLQLALPALLAS
jgi:hypothetical protein